MAPTPVPDPLGYTYTYRGIGTTYTYTYSYPDYTSYGGYDYPYDYPFDSNIAQTVVAAWVIAIGIIFGIQVLGLIIVAIVYFQRQRKRKAWYGPMAAHYRNGGLPPWAMVGNGSVKAPLLPNDYNANSGVTYPPINYSDPKAQYENPTQFGVYGNLPPSHASNTQTTGPYSNATGVTGYSAASYHTASNVPPTPPPQPLSPPPQHSQYTSTTGSFEPYGAPPNVYNANPYAPPAVPPTQLSASPPPGTPTPYGAVPAYGSPPKGPGYTEASGSSQVPAYSSGAYGANEYPKEKGWEYTAPPAGYEGKQ